MSTTDPLPGFEDRAPRDRYCDLILTGGVTSAVAYPAAIFALAMAYRFNSIGGSSSGAGTAALAAAAEYRRRHGSSDGFRILLERTAALADDVGGRTGLEWLFQPARHNRRLFKALVPGIARPYHKAANVVFGLVKAYGLLGTALGAGIAGLAWWFARLLEWSDGTIGVLVTAAFLIGSVIAGAAILLRDVARVVNDGYGICSGIDRLEGAPHPPLTQWLHDLIQEIAGRQKNDPPLTFADLASAPGSPRDTLGDLSPPGAVSIKLQMYTTNVTHGRPYVFPQPERIDDLSEDEEDDPPLYFRLSEMSRLFPREVVEFMRSVSDGKASGQHEKLERPKNTVTRWLWSTPAAVREGQDDELWRLPRKRLPIVVAARMSVSFPVLFTAVPLWTIDRRQEKVDRREEKVDRREKVVFRRCVFSDGGLCSNFPIHLFDSLLPPWPTFGISLHEKPSRMSDKPPKRRWYGARGPIEGGTVFLPEDHRRGWENRWNEFDYEGGTLGRLAGFAGALLSTATSWNDATLARLPGVRDRVAQVGLNRGIGGLNILMKGSQIDSLAKLGGKAALKLLDRFAAPSRLEPDQIANGWNEHRWVRFSVFWESLADSLAGLTWSTSQNKYATPIRELIRQAVDEVPLKCDERTRLLAADAAALDGVLTALIEAERVLTGHARAGQPYISRPRPVMRVRPPL